MRKVKFHKCGVAGEHHDGYFHKWVTVENTLCAVVEDEGNNKIHLVHFELVTFVDKPAEDVTQKILAKWDSDGVPEARTS